MSQQTSDATVLVVEDERNLADLFTEYLDPHYTVHTAYSGKQAVELLSSDIDIVLLDRRMPDMSGEEVLNVILEEKIDTRVAMVTAVDPDFDIIDLGIDDYLVKPIDQDDLVETVEKLIEAEDLEVKKQELSAKQVKRNVLEVEKSPEELAQNDDFKRLTARIQRLKSDITTHENESGDQESSDPNRGVN